MSRFTTQEPHNLKSVAAAAAYLGVSQRTVREMTRTRALRTYRVGRRVLIDQADLDAFLAANENPAA